jgi:hypothetical protein
MRDRQLPREVGEEDDARLERSDEQRLPTGVSDRQLPAELLDSASDLMTCEVDLARSAGSRLWIRAQEASLNR